MKKRKEKPMTKYAPIYIYATEMISDYYSKLKIKNKKVLTVCGSGDQVLNAYFFGARKVVGFDLNKRSEFIARLKIAAIKQLDYKEFLQFFGERKVNSGFDYKIYLKIRKGVDKKTRDFFDNLYKKYSLNGEKMVKSDYFRQRGDFESRIKEVNFYLKNEKTYLKMKKIIKSVKFEFIREDIKNIHLNKKLKKQKFDIINLSNVTNYVVMMLERAGVEDPVMYFFNNTLMKITKKLTQKGKMFYYAYSSKIYPNQIGTKPPLMSKKQSIKKVKSALEATKRFRVTEISFRGIQKQTRDKIVLLERKV